MFCSAEMLRSWFLVLRWISKWERSGKWVSWLLLQQSKCTIHSHPHTHTHTRARIDTVMEGTALFCSSGTTQSFLCKAPWENFMCTHSHISQKSNLISHLISRCLLIICVDIFHVNNPSVKLEKKKGWFHGVWPRRTKIKSPLWHEGHQCLADGSFIIGAIKEQARAENMTVKTNETWHP